MESTTNSHYSHTHINLTMLRLFFIFIFIFYIFLSLPTGNSDLTTDRAALLSLRVAVGGRTLLWNITQQSPCQWAGVKCENNQVTSLRLPGVSLSGEIPTGTIGSLTNLRTLSLRLNALTGPLPSDLASCVNLRNLYLQGNHFSGPLPEFLLTIHSLVRLNLAGNNFSGEISTKVNNLTHLRTLYLENNQLTGSILELNLPNLQQFNVSFNQLNGSVPKSLQSMPESSFLGNHLCGSPLNSCSTGTLPPIAPAGGGNPPFEAKKKTHKLSPGAIAGIVIGSVLGFIFLFLLLLIFCRRRSSKKMSSVDVARTRPLETVNAGEKSKSVIAMKNGEYSSNGKGEFGNVEVKKLVFFGNADKVFDLEDLLRASAEVLGKGTFGTAYKAVLESGIVVAVKRLKEVKVSENEFEEKIEAIGAMNHENLVPLRAYYYSTEEKLLVYDYMSMGSLSALLHGNKAAIRSSLNWEARCAIALGTARGIEYLHSQGATVSHGNIKSSNILLTRSFGPRLSDFGLAHLVGPISTPNRVGGYRAPEVTDPRKVSQKADVYSFGVLLLELLTGKAPTHSVLNEDGVDLPRWVQSTVREEWTNEVFDRELEQNSNVEEMVQLLQLGIDCAAQYPDSRPSMVEIRGRIEELQRPSLRGDESSQSDIVKESY